MVPPAVFSTRGSTGSGPPCWHSHHQCPRHPPRNSSPQRPSGLLVPCAKNSSPKNMRSFKAPPQAAAGDGASQELDCDSRHPFLPLLRFRRPSLEFAIPPCPPSCGPATQTLPLEGVGWRIACLFSPLSVPELQTGSSMLIRGLLCFKSLACRVSLCAFAGCKGRLPRPWLKYGGGRHSLN